MSLQNFVGRQVVVIVSDPWDFCSQHGTGPFSMAVEGASGDELLLRLANGLTYKGVVFDRMVATARHADDRLLMIANRDGVSVNLTPVPSLATSPQADDAFGRAARWRGWHLIGMVSAS
jgi:hypothetical protein